MGGFWHTLLRVGVCAGVCHWGLAFACLPQERNFSIGWKKAGGSSFFAYFGRDRRRPAGLSSFLRFFRIHPAALGVFQGVGRRDGQPRRFSRGFCGGVMDGPAGENAIFKMTSQPAQKLGIQNRGILKKQAFADLVIFDPNKVRNLATYKEAKFPEGIIHVLVNGKFVVRESQTTNNLPGKLIRKNS